MRLLLLLAGLAAFSGCATTTNTTNETTYWTEKSGIMTVHHVVGTVDHPEKLTQKRLAKEEIAAYKLPKGTYFKVESEHTDPRTAAAKAEAKGTTKDAQSAKAEPKAKEGGASNDRIAEKIDALKREVETVSAENRRLQDQITAAAAQAAPQDRQQTVQQDTDAPRLSQ
jgi:hypothetical protein